MSTIPCGSCAIPGDLYLCPSCTSRLRGDLLSVAWLVGELETTLSRQGRTARQVGGSHTKHKERPLPYDPKASEVGWLLHNVLSTTARDLCETRGITCTAVDTSASLAAWLARHVDAVRTEESAGQIMDEVTDAVAQVHRVINTPAGRVFAGPCGAERDEGRCGADLYAAPGKAVVVCPTCAAEHDVDKRRVWLLEQVSEYAGTAAELERLLPWFLGAPIKATRIRQWASRRVIEARWATMDGQPMYRIGDVLNAHARTVARVS